MRWIFVLMMLAGGVAVAQQEQAAPAGAGTDASEPAAEQVTEQAAEQVTEQPAGQASGGVKTLSGMSILGNEEAPKSLVIVPWKSSRIGDGVGVTNSMDDRARPVDRDVFMRELRYFELRSATDRNGS